MKYLYHQVANFFFKFFLFVQKMFFYKNNGKYISTLRLSKGKTKMFILKFFQSKNFVFWEKTSKYFFIHLPEVAGLGMGENFTNLDIFFDCYTKYNKEKLCP